MCSMVLKLPVWYNHKTASFSWILNTYVPYNCRLSYSPMFSSYSIPMTFMSQCLYINLYYMFIEKQERRWLRFYHTIRNLIKSTDRTHLLVIYWPLLCGGGSGWAMFDRFPCVGGRGSSCFLEIAHVYLYTEIRNEFVAMIDKWYSFFFSESVNHHLWKEFND